MRDTSLREVDRPHIFLANGFDHVSSVVRPRGLQADAWQRVGRAVDVAFGAARRPRPPLQTVAQTGGVITDPTASTKLVLCSFESAVGGRWSPSRRGMCLCLCANREVDDYSFTRKCIHILHLRAITGLFRVSLGAGFDDEALVISPPTLRLGRPSENGERCTGKLS